MALDAAAIAARLEQAWITRVALEPLTETDALSAADAYAVQHAWTQQRVADGERVVGRKIGLTSAAMRQMAGVDEPDYGSLWGSREFVAENRRAEVPAELFVSPRVEGELAFLLERPLVGGSVGVAQVLAATAAVATAVEIVDSRIRDWRLKLADTVADNASYGGFVVGPWSQVLRWTDLGTIGMVVHRNGAVAGTGVGVDALGGPAHAVAWLANKLAEFGEHLSAGSIVLSGALGGAIPAVSGDLFTLRVSGERPLTVRFV